MSKKGSYQQIKEFLNNTNLNHTKVIKIWLKTNGQCWYCEKKLSINHNNKSRNDNFIIEHQNTRSSNINNLFPSCHCCNLMKKQKNLEEFRIYYFKDYSFNKKQIEILLLNNIDVNKLLIPKKYFYGEKLQKIKG